MDQNEHTILFDAERCIGCVACSVACPTRAIRVRHSLARLKPELCIDCGACVEACAYEAARARTSSPSDLQRFRYRVAIPSLTLYAQFGRDVHPAQVLDALTRLGFESAYDLSWMSETLGQATDAWLTESRGPWPKISVTCPAIVRLIQIRYPELLPNLIPLESGRELAAKMLRRRLTAEHGLAPEDIGIFFVTPCTAIMNSILAPVGLDRSHFDGAFALNELYGPLLKAIKQGGPGDPDARISARGVMWALAGGMTAGMRNANTMTVHGMRDVQFVFDRIEAGKFQSVDFIEAWSCPDGCVSGGLTMEGRYAAQRAIQHLVKRLGEQDHPVKEEKVRAMLREHFFDLEEEIRARESRSAARDLREAIAWKKERAALLARLPRKDCAACGAPDCATLADDILRGEASLDDCVFLRIARLEGRGESEERKR